MSKILDDVRELAGDLGVNDEMHLVRLCDYASSCPFCGNSRRSDDEGRTIGYDHHPECSWLSMARLVAVVEAAERVARRGSTDGPVVYVDWDDHQALVAALGEDGA